MGKEKIPILGQIYTPVDGVGNEYKVIAIDVYGRVFIEATSGAVYFYKMQEFINTYQNIKNYKNGNT